MKSVRNGIAILSLSTALLAAAAHAQAPAAGAADSVTNAGTPTAAAGEAVNTTPPEAAPVDAVGTEAAPLANTGGSPLLMVLGGIVIAGGSLLLRRKFA